MPISWVRNFTLNQCLGSVNYNMDKKSIFWVHKSEKKEESWKLVRVSKVFDSIFGVPKASGLIFRGQQCMNLRIESKGVPLGIFVEPAVKTYQKGDILLDRVII